ncbi:hypothetical protein CPTAKMNP4_004 [Salmonella phage vB_SenM-AKM_NP4]|uniref:RIIA.1 n=4 Tax=Gelderlandvirus TaxID=1913653 RepID=M1EAK6_BPS16|nr:RIIA.1 [Salmonella phage vB_SenM-S16]YP_009126211.1 hypothetical protein STP4a_002 [Salmonella phage STP4-a]YP_009147996.1 hypothetical protein ACQ31_gp071 [Salmonella phage STML-198]YP_009615488.1 hypothetical protein FDI73_gp002 [Salmonella phage Melville]UFK27127.1 hypothetical protein LG358_00106 [Escherichia phage UoN_LG358_1]UPW42376.1 hypothetical protein EBPHNEJP_00078 [Salmonella phage CF-SP2]WDR21670.1 rIIA lysis inhibitor [Salmonella phage vB_SenM_UTK0003]WLI71629.1 hypothetica
MKSFNVCMVLFDDAVYKEYRIIQRFFDMSEAEDFKERFKEIRFKIQNNTATAEELLEVAELIKRNQD